MAKKKDKGGGGGGKKAGKASKLAKMNEQERVKYLERKMAEEEEVKRRKEEMVSVFMKMKLGREEKKSKLNTSKLIDFWRTKRRVVKTVELEQDVTTLKDAFERALVKKNRLIELLLQDLDEAEEQYNMVFRAQVDMMTEMMDIHNARLADLIQIHESERTTLLKRSMKERKKMDKNQSELEHYLDDVVIALNQRHVALEQETKAEYAVVKEDVRNKNLEEKQALQLYLEETTDNMWRRLQNMVIDFKSSTEEKRRNYNELLAKDKKGVGEVAENNKKIEKLMEDVGKLKETLAELSDTEEKRLSGLRIEREELTKELHDTRRAVSINYRNKEQRKMEKLALYTSKLEKAVSEILLNQDQMIKLSQNCMKLEDEFDDYASKKPADTELSNEEKSAIRKADKKIASYNPLFKNLDVILEKQNNVDLELSILRFEHRNLCGENSELKTLLREYFHTLATSSDLAGDGLLQVQKQRLKKKRRPRPKSYYSFGLMERLR